MIFLTTASRATELLAHGLLVEEAVPPLHSIQYSIDIMDTDYSINIQYIFVLILFLFSLMKLMFGTWPRRLTQWLTHRSSRQSPHRSVPGIHRASPPVFSGRSRNRRWVMSPCSEPASCIYEYIYIYIYRIYPLEIKHGKLEIPV